MKIKNRECLCSHGNIEGREQILEILEAGMQAADPYYNTASMIKITSDRKLHIGDPAFVPLGSPKTDNDIYTLGTDIKRIFVFGAGKIV